MLQTQSVFPLYFPFHHLDWLLVKASLRTNEVTEVRTGADAISQGRSWAVEDSGCADGYLEGPGRSFDWRASGSSPADCVSHGFSERPPSV